jgi:hypothetical protein
VQRFGGARYTLRSETHTMYTTVRPFRWRSRGGALAILAGLGSACSPEGPGFTLISPVASVSPEVLTFAPLVANEEVAVQQLFVTNSGPVTLTVSDVALEGEGFSLLTPTELEVESDETVTVDVQFAPTEVLEYEGMLTLATDDLDNAVVRVPLLGTGRVPYAPDIDIPSLIVVWEVPFPDTEIKAIEIANVGDADLMIYGIDQSGAGAFDVIDDPTGKVVQPGNTTAMLVRYTPRPDLGDSGAIVIDSNDPDESLVTVNLEGNGGGPGDEYPVAVIDCPGEIGLAGPQVVDFDGSASSDPQGGALTYDWEVSLRPNGAAPNNTIAVDAYDPAFASLLLDAPGEWEVALTVTNDADPPLSSVPAKCRIGAVPEDRISVHLSWGNGPTSDMDLHLARDLGDFYVTPGDVSWCNANPDWGTAGFADDDPRLDVDDDDGYGPEIINVFEPVDGEYQVRVHLFDDADDGDTTATVTVSLDGEEAWSGSKLLARNEVWDVGRILWPEMVFSPDNGAPWDAEGVRECR